MITRNELKRYIYSDLYRYEGENAKKIKVYYINTIINRGFRYTLLKRKTLYYKKKKNILFYFYRLIMRYYSSKYGFQFPYDVCIGEGFSINHWGRIIINKEAILGKNVSISTGVVIGKEFRGRREGAPIIGDKVYIGANSVIVGKVNIGENVLIAPNSYINMDVPANSIVIGNPAKIIINKVNATEEYICNVYKEKNKISEG